MNTVKVRNLSYNVYYQAHNLAGEYKDIQFFMRMLDGERTRKDFVDDPNEVFSLNDAQYEIVYNIIKHACRGEKEKACELLSAVLTEIFNEREIKFNNKSEIMWGNN